MAKYIKKPVVVEATQWVKNGDHPQDGDPATEGKVVRYYHYQPGEGHKPCKYCGEHMQWHGWIDTLEGGHIVCPGDFIITGVRGEHYPCKPDIFKETYCAASEKEIMLEMLKDQLGDEK